MKNELPIFASLRAECEIEMPEDVERSLIHFLADRYLVWVCSEEGKKKLSSIKTNARHRRAYAKKKEGHA